MAFSKFDPAKAIPTGKTVGEKRGKWIRLLSIMSLVYTALGFVFLGIFYFVGNPFR